MIYSSFYCFLGSFYRGRLKFGNFFHIFQNQILFYLSLDFKFQEESLFKQKELSGISMCNTII